MRDRRGWRLLLAATLLAAALAGCERAPVASVAPTRVATEAATPRPTLAPRATTAPKKAS